MQYCRPLIPFSRGCAIEAHVAQSEDGSKSREILRTFGGYVEASKLDLYETLYSQAFDSTSRPAKNTSYLATMGPPFKSVSTLATSSRDIRSLTLGSQPPSTVSDAREFSDIDTELLAVAGVDD